MSARRLLAISVCLAGVLLGPREVAQAGSLCEPATVLVGTVTHVRDGDTFVLGDQPIRLQGIAAPERSEPGGERATDALRGMVVGQQVQCSLDGTSNHDRCVAICYVGNYDLGWWLVRLGYARDCPAFSLGRNADAEVAAAMGGEKIRATYPLPRYCGVAR